MESEIVLSTLTDYYTYKQIAAAILIILIIIGVVIYYATLISKFNKRMKAITDFNNRLTTLLNKEAELNQELLYCYLESRKADIEQELKAIDDEWKQVVEDLKKISLEE